MATYPEVVTLPPVRRLSLLSLLLAVVAALVMVTVPARVDARTTASTTQDDVRARTTPKPRKDVRKTRGLFVDPKMKAALAGPAFRSLAAKAQPLWITDAYAQPGQAVQAYVKRAAAARKTPLMVVYNIPGRDCGLYSSQQQQVSAAKYRTFVAKAAKGIKGTQPIVVLEPDALPFIGFEGCDPSATKNWPALLRYATKQFTKAGAWVYLDAGHSGWQTPERMAALLKQAGIAGARGFSTNVANSRATSEEQAYATAVVRALRSIQVTGVKYVTDTSRNGVGAEGRPVNGDVCNPLTARVGAAPKLRFNGAFDGNLWVKLPGESDGPCNGGPSSGEFFPTGACRLMGTSSSYYDSSSRTCRP